MVSLLTEVQAMVVVVVVSTSAGGHGVVAAFPSLPHCYLTRYLPSPVHHMVIFVQSDH